MAYVGGLYTGASQAAAAEGQRFREFQTNVDEMAARERAGLYRRDQAAMDQFTAALTPQSNVALPDLTMPAAPPMPAASLPKTGGGADSGGAAQASYERNRALEQRKMLANQYESETGAFNSLLTDLGKRKYILEQQLSVAPAYQQQAIRAELSGIEKEIRTTVQSGRERVQTIGDLIKTIDENIRLGDYTRGRGVANTGVQPLDQAKPLPGRNAPLGVPEGPAPIPKPDSLGMPPDYEAEYAAGAVSRAGLAGLPPYVVDTSPKAPAAPAATARDQTTSAAYDVLLAPYSSRPEATTRNYAATIVNPLREAPLQFVYDFFTPKGEVISRQQAQKTKDEVVQWYEKESVRNSILADPAAIAEAQRDPVGYYQRNKSKIGKEAAAPAGPTPVADAVAASTTAGGKTDREPAPGVAPPQTPEGEAAANPPLAMTEDVALDTTDPRLAQITQYSAQSVATRAAELPTKLSAVVSSDAGQAIIKRARELGIDPAAAMAIYGIESSFGAKAGDSIAGATGVLQVDAKQWPEFQKNFLDPAFIARYNIPKAMQDVVRNAKANSIDAGLMRLKYNEIIGVEKNLWGAAYQTSAEAVKRAGRPLARHDAGQDKNKIEGLTNSDYNKLYVTLYNEVRGYVNVPPRTDARGTGQSIAITELGTQQSVVEQNYQRTIANTEQTYNRLVQQREVAMQNLNRAREFSKADDMTTYATEVASIDEQINGLNSTLYEAQTTARIAVDALNIQRVKAQIGNAVSSLRNGKPELFAQIYSTVSGMELDIKEMSDGETYAVYYNGELVSGNGVTAAEIEKAYRSDIDSAFAATEASAAEEAKKQQGLMWLKKLEIEGNITLKELEINGKILEMQQNGDLSNPQRKEDENGNLIGLYFTDKQRNIIEFRTGAPGTTPQGMPTTGNVEVLVHSSRKQ